MKSKFYLSITVLLFIFTKFSYSQEYKITGKIVDIKTNHPLEFANIKVIDTTYGTAADKKGEYILKLKKGSWKLIASYLGYFSDTTDIFIENENIERNIFLSPTEIFTETIEVLGEDPAVEILRKAIEYKKKFRENLNEYDFSAYTKYVIRSNTGGVSDTIQRTDSSKYPILSLMESESHGYFKKPDLYKDVVKSRREAESSTISGLALPFIVNFYDEEIDMNYVKIKSPLADDALDYYNYKLLGTTSIDSQIVYRIDVSGSSFTPGFKGKIYISSPNYALMKIDLSINEAVNIPAVDKLNFKEKFTEYTDKKNQFWMPTDIQMYADGSFAGLIKFSFDAFTIVSSYNLNKKAPPGIFDDYIIKVLPDARKDSSYWSKNQLIKNSNEENKALTLLKKENSKSKHKLTFGYPLMQYGNNFSIGGKLPYHYNRVEGNYLDLNLNYRNTSRRLETSSYLGYGFADKKTKYEINYSQAFLKDKSLKIEASIYQKLQPLSYNLSDFYALFNSLTSLFDKQDYYDYYYANGYNINVSKTILPQLGITIRYNQEKQTSAKSNTNYSIRKHDDIFRYNPKINDSFQRAIGINLNLNPNKFRFADLGDDEIESYEITNYPQLNLGFDFSSKKLGSTFENKKYRLILSGENYFNNFINFSYILGGAYYVGDVPFQSLAFFNATTAVWDKEFSFKTMNYREYLGDYILYLYIENNFRNIIWSKLPLISKLDLIGFFNAGKCGINNSNLALVSNDNFSVLDKLFCEAGFGIKGILNIIRADFAWRLTNRIAGRNFNFSLTFGF